MVCIPLGSLLTASVTGVNDSVTWGQQDRFCWESILHSFIEVDSSFHTRLNYIAPLQSGLTELVSQGANQKGFASPRRPHDNEVEVLNQPLALSPFEELGFFQTARDLKVNVG